MNEQTKTANNMKKFFKVLLLAAVALMPVMGMAQDNSERDYAWERQMRSQEYADSVQAAKQQAQYAHEMAMHSMTSGYRQQRFDAFWNSGVLPCCILGAGAILVLVLCLRHSRRKAEDHKELINKLIDNNLLNSTEPISKEAIEALMKPKKSDKDKIITDATLVGLGLGLGFASNKLQGGANEILVFAAYILLFLGALRLVIRTIFMIIGYFANKKRKSKIEAKEAEVVEEK